MTKQFFYYDHIIDETSPGYKNAKQVDKEEFKNDLKKLDELADQAKLSTLQA